VDYFSRKGAQRGKAATEEDRGWRMDDGKARFAFAQKIFDKMNDLHGLWHKEHKGESGSAFL
jgi:hypothetical protein